MNYQNITLRFPALSDEAAAALHNFISALMYAVDDENLIYHLLIDSKQTRCGLTPMPLTIPEQPKPGVFLSTDRPSHCATCPKCFSYVEDLQP